MATTFYQALKFTDRFTVILMVLFGAVENVGL